jgi:group I intron endonuclease
LKISCIYIIRSKIKPYRIYIGSAVDFVSRKISHKKDFKRGHPNRILQSHANKYGVDDLVFEIAERVNDSDTLLLREQYWIDLLNPFFNICKIAGSRKGVMASISTKLKMSKSRKGLRFSWGHPQTDEHRYKISMAKKGKKRTLEERKILSESHKGIGKAMKYLVYIKEQIGVKNQYELAKELGIHQSTISKMLKRCA